MGSYSLATTTTVLMPQASRWCPDLPAQTFRMKQTRNFVFIYLDNYSRGTSTFGLSGSAKFRECPLLCT